MPKCFIDKEWGHFFDTFVHFVESSECLDCSPKMVYLGTNLPKGFDGILYNTEQLTIPDRYNKIVSCMKENPGLEVWDYSQVNIGILAKAGIMAKYIPLYSPSWYIEKLRGFRSELVYDIGFNGSPSPRRENILSSLRAKGFKVLYSTAWGEERDKELGKCRVLLNIHYSTDHLIFETARCEPWLRLGVPIISELSIENDRRCILTTYDGFVDTVVRFFRLVGTTA